MHNPVKAKPLGELLAGSLKEEHIPADGKKGQGIPVLRRQCCNPHGMMTLTQAAPDFNYLIAPPGITHTKRVIRRTWNQRETIRYENVLKLCSRYQKSCLEM